MTRISTDGATTSLTIEGTDMPYRHMNKKSMLVYAVALLAAYALSVLLSAGWATYFLGLPAYIFVGLTCLARANDLVQVGKLYDARRFGFAIMAGLALLFIFEPLFNSFPIWPRVFFMWALALIWLGTPGLPPWWEWATGAWDHYDLRQKVVMFFKSLHGNPKP